MNTATGRIPTAWAQGMVEQEGIGEEVRDGKCYTIWVRFWRRTEDAFYYNRREVAEKGNNPHMPRKVPEEELAAA